MTNTNIITVPFHGNQLFVIDNNGQPITPMRPIVEGMGLSYPPPLTATPRRAYDPPVAGKQPATGIGVLMYAAMSRDSVLQSGFFASGVPSWAGRTGEPQGSPVHTRYANPVRLRPPRLASWCAVRSTNWSMHP